MDRGWVDQVQFTASLIPVVVVEPQDITVQAGDAALLSVTAQGASPMGYQWFYNNQPLPFGNGAELLLTAAQIENGGTYYVVLTNSYGTATSRVARLDVVPGMSLSEALDNSDLSFSTGGNLPWESITNASHDAVDSARSGGIGHDGQSWMQTTLTGPGRLSFWWNVSSESCCDELALLLDGNVIEVIRGLMDWALFSLDVSEGPHVVRWVYLKDGTVSAGADAGGVDQVTFTPWTSNNVHVVSSTQPFEFPASGPANDYPSTVLVSNLAAGVTDLTVTLQGLSHTFPDDLDILLVGPNQTSVMLLSDIGGGTPISNAVVTLADFAPLAPNDGPILDGFYRPTDVASDSDLFPLPAPGEPYATNLSVFANADPNGIWRLFIRDDSDGDSGSLQGWSLNFRLQTNSLVPFKLSSTLASGEISVRFPTSPSAEYVVEYKDALDQTAWQNLLVVPGDGTVQSVRQPVVPGANRFFRVRMEPGARR
jgi:subtilisin-like proprotein convertase family protein